MQGENTARTYQSLVCLATKGGVYGINFVLEDKAIEAIPLHHLQTYKCSHKM